nr:FAD-dependent oxidoreductase [Clostridiales bacterium]
DCVICASKGSMFAVKAKVYIDCTGDGDMCFYAGAEYEYGDENGRVMATTLCGLWDGIDWSRVVGPDSRELDRAFADHVFTNEDCHHSGMWRIAAETQDENGKSLPNGIGGSNVGHIYDIDGSKAESVTPGLVKGRTQLREHRRYYRDYLTGFANAELIYSGSYLGIRESRRITGDYRLVLDDFKNRASFDDEIGRYSYPVDIHSPTNDKAGYEKFKREFESFRYKTGESYGIPYRTLTVKGFDNLLAAGRCISTDRYMQSSIRVMPGCYITGQAAGIAASVSIDEKVGVHSADTHEIQKKLVKLGAFLPNYRD